MVCEGLTIHELCKDEKGKETLQKVMRMFPDELMTGDIMREVEAEMSQRFDKIQ